MKLRRGFVSNSSSTSFIVCLKGPPKSIDDLKSILFGDERDYQHPFESTRKKVVSWPTREIASIVFHDLEPIDLDRAVEEVSTGYVAELESDPDIQEEHELVRAASSEEFHDIWVKYATFYREKARDYLDRFLRSRGAGRAMFLVRYSGNDGQRGAAMEYGNLFDRVPHIRINNH